MSKRRIPSSKRRPSRAPVAVKGKLLKKSALKTTLKAGKSIPPQSGPSAAKNFVRFMGLALSGGKSDKSCLAIVDFYESSNRLFLNRIFDRVKAEEFISSDHKIHELVQQFSENTKWILMDVPLTLPVCGACELNCPGYETCTEPELKWMRALYQKQEKRKPKKMLTPYTQRAADLYLQELDGGIYDIQHTLGANLAPLVVRARFIKRRLSLESLEAAPKIAVWRLGMALKVGKAHLKSYRNSVGGDEARRLFLQALSEKTGIFFYVHDLKLMIENYHAFDAFICAYTGYLKYIGQTEPRPRDYPSSEAWVEFPKP